MTRLDTLLGTGALVALRGVMAVGAAVAYLQLVLAIALMVTVAVLVLRLLA